MTKKCTEQICILIITQRLRKEYEQSKKMRKPVENFSLSAMLFLGVPEKYAMERGGWSSPSIMTSVYQHTLSDERKHFDTVINDYFEKNLTKTKKRAFLPSKVRWKN